MASVAEYYPANLIYCVLTTISLTLCVSANRDEMCCAIYAKATLSVACNDSVLNSNYHANNTLPPHPHSANANNVPVGSTYST